MPAGERARFDSSLAASCIKSIDGVFYAKIGLERDKDILRFQGCIFIILKKNFRLFSIVL